MTTGYADVDEKAVSIVTPTPRDPGHFVRGMERWRAELGLSSNAFADYLGVSRSYWSLVRRGLRPLSMAIVNRVLRERPELAFALPADAATPSSRRPAGPAGSC